MPLSIPLKRLTEGHTFLPFDCGDSDLNEFLLVNAIQYQEQLLAVTYYLETEEDTVLFFSLSNDKITSIENKKSFWRKIRGLFPHSKHRKDYPAVKIGRLGVNKKYQHTGVNLGSHILDYIKDWMVNDNKTGCHFITVDAYVDVVPFYQKNDFLFMGAEERKRYEKGKGDTVAMYFDLFSIKQ